MKGVSLSRVCVCGARCRVCVLPTLSLFSEKRRFLFYLGFHVEELQFYFLLFFRCQDGRQEEEWAARPAGVI